jgi:3-deoxy-D-manno-octulosonic-acid transferase
LGQRYGIGLRRPAKKRDGSLRIWIHAASVGEVQASRVLINELILRKVKCEFFLSTMTKQGRSVASSQMPPEISCFLAPLDVPVTVRRFLDVIEPDLYVCLETELWPAMFFELHKSGIPSLILNGRMTQRSLRRYRMVSGLMGRLLGNLKGLAVISREDGERFKELGAPSESVRITGNIKYDYPVEDVDKIREAQRKVLQAGEKIVFICGSTRTGEEQILIRVFKALEEKSDKGVLWVIAPRHLKRLGEVQQILAMSGLEYDLYSNLKSTRRSHSVVLVDTMGDLGKIYSAGDFNFVGGSLVGKRGHNLMEAARWGRPVYFGPSIDDFRDAAEILENGGAAFRVADGDELAALLTAHLRDKKVYEQACANAAHAVSLQRGAAGKQADMLLNLLPGPVQNM